MPTFNEFCERLQERLGLDDSYRAEDIPSSVRRYVKKLLRDYYFPQSVRTQEYTGLAANQQTYALPAGFKKELLVLFRDVTTPTTPAYSEPLMKREGFVPAHSDGIPRNYWITGSTLWTDIKLGSGDYTTTQLVLAYLSSDVDYNLEWMLAELEDVLFSLSMFRLAGELNKPELAQIWIAMWTEDQRSLAIYQNELEYGNLDMVMRPAADRRAERYPK